MYSSIPIPVNSQGTLDAFCSTNKVPPVSVYKLVFATLLHQYFDLHEFTFDEVFPEAHDDNARDLTTKGHQVQYASELASTTSIRAAFHLSETDIASADDSTPLLVNDMTNAGQNGKPSANKMTAGLIVADQVPTSAAASTSSLASQHNGLGLIVYFDKVSRSALLLHKANHVSEFVATGFADAFAAALQCISSSPIDTMIAILDTCGPHSRERISKWNQYSISAPNKLLHEVVGRGFTHKPDAIAILSWDGQLSYSELDKRSTSLAAYLMETYDLKPGKKVALCFEKSTWAVVSMLAVLKAGAAYCCLDPSHPSARHESIIQTLNAPLVITSALHQSRFDGHRILVPTVELVSQERQYQPTDVQPSDTCIVAFTSGSTGTPKGIVHTHNSLVTGILSNATPQCLDREGVSTFQWSNFTFDVSMVEIYAPLIFGGRICIPSDEERVNNVEETMNRMGVNWAYFTPSFARLFAHYNIPSLQTLLLGGEVVTPDDINAWYNRVTVIHSYGPAESATFFLYQFDAPCSKIVPIGPAPNTYSWIVHPDNPELLSPLGAIGEMLYEGPGLLKEYLGNPEKTKAVLIDAPSWRKSLDAPAPTSKLYKSGDLVRYLPDGTMMYIGRKDTMVKVRGQRLEVEEVESVMRKSLGGSSQVAVDLVDLLGSGPKLVAFLQCPEDQGLNGHTNGSTTGTHQSCSVSDGKMKLITQLRSRLMDTLPEYMVPRIYIPLASLPTTPNGKLDRAKLKEHAQSLPTSELFKYTESSSSEEILTEIPQDDAVALEISEILDKVLRRAESNGENPLKGKNATLENLGLDSLSLVSLARAVNAFYGLNIPIKTFRRVDLNVVDIADIVRSRNKAGPQSDERARATNILQDIEELDKSLAKVSKVIVLVRAKDASTGLQRIVAAATTAKWWSPELADHIEVWLGDLARPRLGVSTDQWARLEGTCAETSEAVTAVIHNGAVVNWSSSYERLRATNVLSTVQILELALAGAGYLRHLTYVSGGEMHLTEAAVAKDPSRLSSADGYSQSKFASDLIVQRCVARVPTDRRVNMVKPGIIIGTATEGISNTDDYIWRLVAGACEAGAYVDGEQDAVVCLAGADHVARRIIDACLGGKHEDDALRMMQGVTVRDFWKVVSEGTGLELQAMNFDDWLKVVNANVSRKGPSHLLWPVMEWVEQRKGRIGDARLATCKAGSCTGHYLGPDIGQGNSTHVAECAQGKETKEETLKALRKSVDYLSGLRFLQDEVPLDGPRQDVFRRSAVNS